MSLTDQLVKTYGEQAFDWADAVVAVLDANPFTTYTASTSARAAKLQTYQARVALLIAVDQGSARDDAGRGGAWMRWATTRSITWREQATHNGELDTDGLLPNRPVGLRFKAPVAAFPLTTAALASA